MAHYCQCSGEPWTDDLEASLTMPRYRARLKYWKRNPPVHVMAQIIARSIGAYKPKDDGSSSGFRPSTNEEVKLAMSQMFGRGFVGAEG